MAVAESLSPAAVFGSRGRSNHSGRRRMPAIPKLFGVPAAVQVPDAHQLSAEIEPFGLAAIGQ